MSYNATSSRAIMLCTTFVTGPPNLQDNFVVRLQEKSEVNVPVDLRQDPPAFPEPTEPNFTWMRNGQPLRSGLTTTYSNVTFDSVARSDAGNYTVTATNFLLNDSTIQVGSDSGSFYLDVLCEHLCCSYRKSSNYSAKDINLRLSWLLY